MITIKNQIGAEQFNWIGSIFNTSQARAYPDCTTPGVVENTQTKTYYVIEKKSARCTNSTHYNLSGWHGTNWIKYAEDTCTGNTVCRNSTNFTAENAYVDPCISQTTCTGTIQVITEDRNGNPMQNLSVSRDDVSNKTTNSVGVAEYSLSQTCNQNMEFKVYCNNSSGAAICGSKTAKLDVVNDYEGLLFDCSICSGTPDIQIDVNNVRTNKAKSNVTVNISLVSSFTAANVNITFKVQGDDGLIKREASQLFNINSGSSFVFVNQTIAMNDNDDFLHIYVDTNNRVAESNEKNNYALVPLFEKQISVYFDVNTGYGSVDAEIKKYIKLFVNEETTQAQADVTLCIGKKCSNFNSLNSYTLAWQNFGYRRNQLIYNNNPIGNKPYNAIVGGFKTNTDFKNYIMTYGSDIDGDIAAVKKLISAKELFLNRDLLIYKRSKVIDDYDLTGISVADLLRNPNNKPYYNQRGSDAFANVVAKILNNNNFEITIKTVKTTNDNTTLRLKNINSDFSANFTDAVIGNSRPVVLARGLWSNLLSWNEFGKKLAFDKDYARDTWLIEITGGPEQDENPNSPNYYYVDLVDYYWPALITGVQNYSAQKVLDYVGFSNGCRVGLDSARNWTSGKNNSGYVFDTTTGNYIISNLGNNSINTFIGVGCPGAFQGQSAFSQSFGEHGNNILNFFTNRGITHISGHELGERLEEGCGITDIKCSRAADSLQEIGDLRISRNLGSDYLNFITNTNDNQPGNGLQIPRLLIIYGQHPRVLGFTVELDSDGVVTRQDAEGILNVVSTTTENITRIDGVNHVELVEDTRTEDAIRRYLR